jgi:hypothetical protein
MSRPPQHLADAVAILRGTLAKLYLAPGGDAALALVDDGGDTGTPMRITRSNYDELTKRDAVERSVVAYCDGQGFWTLRLDPDAV